MNSLRLGKQLKGLISRSINLPKLSKQSYSSLLIKNKEFNLIKLTSSNLLSRCNVQTESDKDLTQFLSKEIQLERQTTKQPKQGLRIPGFDVEQDGANLRLLRKFGDENITIKLNVNGTVDTDESTLDVNAEVRENEQPPLPEMKARPDFSVEIKKSNEKTLVINCSFFADEESDDDELAGEPAQQQQQPDETKGDLFQIDNFYIVGKGDVVDSNDWRDNIYMGDGSLVDGEMYDLLMNYLDERGVGNEFAENLIDYCTHYEHNQYINLLDNLKQFLESK